MLCEKIISVMNKLAPENSALDWDNVGLLVGDKNSDIKKIIIGLDLTDKIIDQAIKYKANMIITHHPIFFHGTKKITGDLGENRRVVRLIKNDICFYAAHTNLDMADNVGTNAVLADLLELDNIEALVELDNCAMGRVGYLKKTHTLEEFSVFVKNKLRLDKIFFYGDKKVEIKKIGLCTGSASGLKYFLLAKQKDCDVYLTGDIKYHDALLTLDLNLNLIDVTHYASERIFAPVLKNELKKILPELDIICSDDNFDLINII